MSYSNPSSENDIRARAAVLAEAILSTNPSSQAYQQIRNEFQQELAQVELPPDTMTWFAVERVANRVGAKAVRVNTLDDIVPNGALVMIGANVQAPDSIDAGIISELKRASFVVAPSSWRGVLSQANLSGLAVDGGAANETQKPSGRTPKP